MGLAFPYKVTLRRKLLREIKDPVVFESCGGYGKMYELCFSHLQQGIVIEKDPKKTPYLARQRPTWRVYECDGIYALRMGVGTDLPVNYFDIDPYGDPWDYVRALFEGWGGSLPGTWGLVVQDGLRQFLNYGGGWKSHSVEEFIGTYGNNGVREYYKEICFEKMTGLAENAGYKIAKWTSYYCGHLNFQTHYAALMKRRKQP